MCCIWRGIKFISNEIVPKILQLFNFLLTAGVIGTFASRALLPYGGTNNQFEAVCFWLIWHGAMRLRLFTKSCRSISAQINKTNT